MLQWIGHTKGKQGIVGIPARDLTDEDVEKYGGEKLLLATGLYVKPKSASKPKSKPEQED